MFVTGSIRRIVISGVALVGSFLCVGCPPVAGRSWVENQRIEVDGMERYYRYYVPEGLPTAAPLVFLLHGGTRGMDTLTRRNGGGPQEWVALADQEKFLLILPNGTQVDTGDPTGEDQNWNDCRSDAPAAETEADDVGFVAALMDWAKREFSVDPERVYATGASNGGLMAYRLATELGGRMAGIAVFIANLPAESECSATTTPVSVFICNGTADLLQPWAGRPDAHPRGTLHSADATRDYWIAINGCDSEPVETVSYPNVNGNDGSTVSSSLYRNVATGAEVKFYAVQGGGHSMPTLRQALPRWIRNSLLLGDQNQDIEGAQHAWAFLKRHTRQE